MTTFAIKSWRKSRFLYVSHIQILQNRNLCSTETLFNIFFTLDIAQFDALICFFIVSPMACCMTAHTLTLPTCLLSTVALNIACIKTEHMLSR